MPGQQSGCAMRAVVTLLFAASLGCAPGTPPAPPAPPILEGTWVVTAVEGHERFVSDFTRGYITFKGSEMSGYDRTGGQGTSATFTLDPAARPVAIDLTPPGRDEPALGILELNGDTLRLCFGNRGDLPRPVEFKAPADSGVVYLTLKRLDPSVGIPKPPDDNEEWNEERAREFQRVRPVPPRPASTTPESRQP